MGPIHLYDKDQIQVSEELMEDGAFTEVLKGDALHEVKGEMMRGLRNE